MGQVIDVPGQGPVEFPAGMTDAQIVAAIKKNSMTAKPSTQELYEDAVKKRGWGSGVPKTIYDAGGKVTDLTGSPVAGGIAHFMLNAVPEMLMAGRVVGAPASLAEKPAAWMMQKAVGPGKAARESGDATRAIKDMLEESIYPTASGMEKAGKIASKMEKVVNAAVDKSPATVKVSDITAPVGDVLKKAERQFVPQGDVAAVEDVWTKALQNPLLAGKTEIPVQLAHELKKGTYQALGGKAYGEVGSTSIEAQKALARGARQSVAEAIPEVAEPLARQAKMMNVMDVAADRALVQGNKNLLSLAPLASGHPLAQLSFLADRWPALKAFLALQMYHGAKPQVLAPLGAALQQTNPEMREDVGALYSAARNGALYDLFTP